jgi:hypothetical protein
MRRRVPQRLQAPHVPHVPLANREEIGESPLWPIAAVLTAAGLYATLPTKFVAGSSSNVFLAARWVVPALTVLLIVPLALSLPKSPLADVLASHAHGLRIGRRIASLAVIAVITAANAASIVLLVHLLVSGHKTIARDLLRAAIHMWCMNVIVFGLWFWQLDGGGPVARRSEKRRVADFLFPQQTSPELAADWQPNFIDYLYVSFTNATAFSPTDTMPLSQWAKILMLVQSAAALLLAVMVAARAVNILQ